MNNLREREIKNLVEKLGMKISAEYFCVSEIELIIQETPLSDEDRRFARAKFIRKMTNEKLLDYMNWGSLNTVIAHSKKVSLALKTTCQRIFK